MKVKYIGPSSPARTLIYDTIINDWKTGEIREIDDRLALKLLKDNKDFTKVSDGSSEVKPVVETKIEKKLDFKKIKEED